MTNDLTQAAIYAALLLLIAVPLGAYIARAASGELRFLSAIERPLLAAAGAQAGAGQRWTSYALSLLAFNAAGFAILFLILRFQNRLPLNPQGFAGLPPDLAFNTAISFVTNTNWQIGRAHV